MEPAVLNLDGGDSLAPDVSIRQLILMRFESHLYPFCGILYLPMLDAGVKGWRSIRPSINCVSSGYRNHLLAFKDYHFSNIRCAFVLQTTGFPLSFCSSTQWSFINALFNLNFTLTAATFVVSVHSSASIRAHRTWATAVENTHIIVFRIVISLLSISFKRRTCAEMTFHQAKN